MVLLCIYFVLYLQVFLIYIFTVATAFILYLQIYLIPASKRKREASLARESNVTAREQNDNFSLKSAASNVNFFLETNMNDSANSTRQTSDSGAPSDVSRHSTTLSLKQQQLDQTADEATLGGTKRVFVDCKTMVHTHVKHAHGSSLYLRLGSLGECR